MRRAKRILSVTTLLLVGAAQADTSTPWTDEYDQQQQAWDAAALAELAGVSPDSLPPAQEEASATDVAQTPLAPDLTAQEALMRASAVPVNSTEPIQVKGCWYVASVGGVYRPGVGLRWQLIVSRLPSTGCAEESRVIDSSYVGGPPVMIAVERQGFALAFGSKQSQMGATHLRLYHVDPATLGVVRQAFLGSPTGMNTHASAMSLEGNRLIVHGTKDGAIPGEVGSGKRFVATYPRFFTSQEAPSIFAHPEPMLVIPTQPHGDEALTEEQRQQDAQALLLEAAALEALRASLASAGEESPARAPEQPAPASFDDGLTELDALAYLQAHEPEKLRALADRPHQVRGCWYFISSGTVGWPPILTRYTLTRMPSRHCQGQTQVIGDTYSGGIQALAKDSQGFAIAYNLKWTRGGSGLVHTDVLAIDPKTMTITRSVVLGTYMGSTYLEGLRFENNNLIVDTSRYTATFPRFLTSTVPPRGVIFP